MSATVTPASASASAQIGDRAASRSARPSAAASRSRPRSSAAARPPLALGLVSTLGRIVVPLAVQQTIDAGIEADGGPDVRRVAIFVAGAAVAW